MGYTRLGEYIYDLSDHNTNGKPTDRQECDKRIRNVFDDAILQKVDSWVAAMAVYRLAYNDGSLEVIPIPNGAYDNPFFTLPSPNGRNGTAQFNMPQLGPRSRGIVAPHALRRPAVELGTYYVVVHGEEVGIYGTWYVFPL